MISLDQIQLLEAKIESAVEKITQLQVENDALRNKCSELSNALSAKSEQLSVCEQQLADQEKGQSLIESGILKALNRLNSIENSVLKSGSNDSVQPAPVAEPVQVAPVIQESPVPETPAPVPVAEEEPSFETEAPAMDVPAEEPAPVYNPEPEPVPETFQYTPEQNSSEEMEQEIDIPVTPMEEESVVNPFDMNKSDVPGFDIF